MGFYALGEASGCMSVIDCSSGMKTEARGSSRLCSESLHYLSGPPLSYISKWKMNTHLEARPGSVCLCAWFQQVGVENVADGLEVSMNLF